MCRWADRRVRARRESEGQGGELDRPSSPATAGVRGSRRACWLLGRVTAQRDACACFQLVLTPMLGQVGYTALHLAIVEERTSIATSLIGCDKVDVNASGQVRGSREHYYGWLVCGGLEEGRA